MKRRGFLQFLGLAPAAAVAAASAKAHTPTPEVPVVQAVGGLDTTREVRMDWDDYGCTVSACVISSVSYPGGFYK